MYSSNPEMNAPFFKKVPRKPSEYMATNVFVGASFASPYEANLAVEEDFSSNLLWGSDYPHIEGTFVYPAGEDKPSVTRLALRNTFSNVPIEKTRRMVADNAIELYGLDRDVLQNIANSINAPTPEEMARPIDAVPEGASTHAFRSGAGAWS